MSKQRGEAEVGRELGGVAGGAVEPQEEGGRVAW